MCGLWRHGASGLVDENAGLDNNHHRHVRLFIIIIIIIIIINFIKS